MTINPNLIPYRVSLEEDKGDKFTILLALAALVGIALWLAVVLLFTLGG